MGKFIRNLVLVLTSICLIYGVASGSIGNLIDLFKSLNDKFVYTNKFNINSIKLNNSDFYYNSLTDNQKNIYGSIAKGVSALNTEVIIGKYEISTIENATEDTKIAINSFLCDHPEVFYLNSQYTVSVTETMLGDILKLQLTYSINDTIELQTKIDQLQNAINDIKNKILEKSTYDQELYVHDYLAKNVKYYDIKDSENGVLDKYHTAYSALIEKEAVCDGISKAFQLILNSLDIENYIVTGSINDTPHAWNLVKIDDNFMHVDITSNKYIKDEQGNTIEPVHTYFNVNDEFIQKNHSIDNKEIFPEAITMEYTYYKKKNSYISSSSDFQQRVNEIVELQNDRKIIEFSTDLQTNVPEKLVKQLQNMKFGNLKTEGNKITMKYYNEQNVYIIPKK